MENLKVLENKKVLIVDDEADVLETLSDQLDMCQIDTAAEFKTAAELMNKNTYDIAIFDIMGVNGYDLLEISKQKDIPALMFTAHALSPDDFAKSVKGGAKAYIPKEKMTEIATFVAELLEERQEGAQAHRKWFTRLKSFFDKQFGYDWQKQHKDLLEKHGWLMWDD
jgi:DNA-binding NtrC family response regulator